MKKVVCTALPLALGMSLLASASFAQSAPPPPPKRERPSPEVMQRMQEGRMAMITTALKLTDDQKKLWAPVEAKLKEQQDTRLKRMQEMGDRQPGATPTPLPDRMERMNKMMAERAERGKAFTAVFKPFYESLNDDQKKIAGMLLGRMGGGHHGRHGMMHRRGPGPGGAMPQ